MQKRTIFYCSLIYTILYIAIIDATHFEGGTITYKILNTTGSIVSIVLTQTYIYDYTKIACTNSMIANQSPKLTFNPPYLENSQKVNCIQYCNQSGGYMAPSVVSYCTDYSTSLGITVGQRSDTINVTNGSYFLVAYQSFSWRQLSLPPTSGSLNTSWSISCLVNLQPRSDGSYNHPPVATIISPIYIPVGIQQTIFIPTIDADNDEVRCRLANGTSECGNACPPASLPNGTILFSNCTLIITGAKVNDWYAIAIQIEDFINSTSTAPISSVPVQFLINVQTVSSCSRRPLLTGPVSQIGGCVGIQVGQPYVIELIAENFCPNSTNISDIATLSFPIVSKTPIVRNTTTLWSVTLTWTPAASAVGTQILCAVAIDSTNVQSNQYCMSFTVAQGSVPTCPGQAPVTTQMTTYKTLITSQLASTQLTTQMTNLASSIAAVFSTIKTTLQESGSTTGLTSISTTTESTTDTTPTSQSKLSYTTDSSMLSTLRSMTNAMMSNFQSSLNMRLSIYSTMPITSRSFNASQVSSNMIPQESSDNYQNSDTTVSIATSSSSNSNLSWPWLAILLAALALVLLTLCICCCCLHCCPQLCLCCPPKRRKKHSSSDEFPQENGSFQSPIYPRIVYNPFENSLNLDDDLLSSTRPSSAASSRNADDIHLTGLTSPTTKKPKPHYALPLQRSPRVAPASPSPDAYVYDNRQEQHVVTFQDYVL